MVKLSPYELGQLIKEHVCIIYDRSLPDHTFNCKLSGIGEAVDRIFELERKRTPRSTGWYVLVKQTDDGWEPVICVNEFDEQWEESEFPEWNQILPIKHPSDVPEWDGF